MNPPAVITEHDEQEPSVLQRRILLSFCATVLTGVTLCAAYLTGAFRERTAPVDMVVIAVPDPPAPVSQTPAVEPKPAASVIPVEAKTGSDILPLQLELIATEDAWVEVDTDGEAKYKRLLRVAEKLSFGASQRIRMMTGNAPGLAVRFNGKPVATGSKGHVRTLEFTSEGVLELNSHVSEGVKQAA